jgi:hypothetical protein
MPPLRRFAVAIALAALAWTSLVAPPLPAKADSSTVSAGALRTGWDPNEPDLTRAAVTGGGFGELFHVPVDGVVFAQPVAARGVIVVATEHDKVYGVDETTGALRWGPVSAGAFEPDDHSCGQVTPHVGITATPVIDATTNTVYVMARDFHGSGNTAWRLHALDLFTGGEHTGWPVTIGGSAHNAPTHSFNAYQAEQRPGLLLLGGSIFAGFGSFCDQEPYEGWIAGVSTSTRSLSLYTDEPSGSEGAFWGSGGGFIADGPNTFLATSGNGRGSNASNDQAPMGSGPANNGTNLGDAVIRFTVEGDGITVDAGDYFSQAQVDNNDLDLGSSMASALPDSMGVGGHPHLAAVGGKFGTLYLLDRDHLGGRHPGDTGAVSQIGTGDLYGHVASWPGDSGGLIYADTTNGLHAYTINGGLNEVSTNSGSQGDGSPLVTSDGTTPGSAVVWVYQRSSRNLVAYGAVPSGGALPELHAWTVGSTGDAHFNDVAADHGRIIVAADDGFVHVFGRPGLPPVPCGCVPPTQGYWLVASDGGIFPFGLAIDHSYGSTGNIRLNQPILGMAATATNNGYWLVASDGGIFPFGDAVQHSYGSTGNIRLNQPIVGMARTGSGNGYWLVASDGGIFPFGDAVQHSYGSTGGMRLNKPIVEMAATVSGNGYWLVASDGGIFPFGDAAQHSYGSTGGIALNKPIVGMARTKDGNGYWLVASDGGIFPFGPSAGGWGSTGSLTLNQPIVGMAGLG